MAISYKPLFKLMIDRDLRKKDFCELTGLGYPTLRKLQRGETVKTDTLDAICQKLGCQLNDIAEVLPDIPQSAE